MVITELIKELEEIKAKHGDVEVLVLEESVGPGPATVVYVSDYVSDYNTKTKEYTCTTGVLIR